MATYATDYSTSNSAYTPGLNGELGVREVTFTVDTALAGDDVIQMIPVAAGERILDVILISEDLDTGGSPAIVLDVGDGDDADRFIDGATIGQAGGMARMNGATPIKTYAADDTIDVTVATGPATGATGVDITLRVFLTRG